MSNIQTKKVPKRTWGGRRDRQEIIIEIILDGLELKKVNFRIEGTAEFPTFTLSHKTSGNQK